MPIQVNELSKHFRLFKREAGLSGALRSFFNRKYENFHALNKISLNIDDGEIFSCDLTPHGKARKIFTIREPLRAISAITPFNHPLLIAVKKIAPALAAGNSVSAT